MGILISLKLESIHSVSNTQSPKSQGKVQTQNRLAALCHTLSTYIGGPVFIPVYGS